MKSETTEWLANLRMQATEPGTLFVAIRGRAGRLVVYPEEILCKSDEELLNFIRMQFSMTLAKPIGVD
jgi:hypothetical protein